MRSSNRIVFHLSLLALYCAVFPFAGRDAAAQPLSKGAPFPNVVFTASGSDDLMEYLGARGKKTVRLDDMRGSLFIVEVFSAYCVSCPKNVPVLNAVYASVEKDPLLRGRVKVFAIAIGNTAEEAKRYVAAHSLLFPVFTDYDFTIHDKLGRPRVPFTLYVKKTSKKKTVVGVHQGVLDSADFVLKNVRSSL